MQKDPQRHAIIGAAMEVLRNFGAPSLQFKRLVQTPSENLRNLRMTLKK
jgi:hypothetical protein